MYKLLVDSVQAYQLPPMREAMKILKKKGVEIVISTPNAHCYNLLVEYACQDFKEEYEFIETSIAHTRNYDLIIITGSPKNWGIFKQEQKLAYMNHGGCGGGNWNPHISWKILTEGFDNGHKSIHYLALGHNDLLMNWPNYHLTGWPKTDELINTETKNKKPRIVIGGHWSEFGIWETFKDRSIKWLTCLKDNYDITAILHPQLFSWDHHSKLLEKIKKKCESNGIEIALDNNSQEIIKKGDLFISDVSSVTYEMAVTGKPILWFHHPSHEFSDLFLQTLTESATIPIRSPEQMFHIIKHRDLSPKKEELKSLIDYMFVNLGSASTSLAEVILGLLE